MQTATSEPVARRRHALVAVLTILPFVLLVIAVARYGFDAPFQDSWAFVKVLERSYAGQFPWAELWAQHNEHRLFFPKLVMLALARATHWDLRVELAATILFAVGTFAVVARMWRRTAKRLDVNGAEWMLPLLSLLLFSMSQWQAWLWGWQLQMTLNILVVVGAVALLTAAQPAWWKLLAAACLGFVATHSFASGLAVWPIGLCLLLCDRSPKRRENAIRVTFWLAATAASVYSYFHGYMEPAEHTAYGAFLKHPFRYGGYVLAYLGAPIAPWNTWAAMACGAIGVVVCVALGTGLVRDKQLGLPAIAPYFGLALYALANAMITGIGRSGYGLGQALSSRYIPFASLLWIPLAALLMIHASKAAETGRRHMARVSRALLCAMAGFVLLAIAYGTYRADERWDAFVPAREALLKGDDAAQLGHLYPDVEFLREQREILRRYRLSVFR